MGEEHLGSPGSLGCGQTLGAPGPDISAFPSSLSPWVIFHPLSLWGWALPASPIFQREYLAPSTPLGKGDGISSCPGPAGAGWEKGKSGVSRQGTSTSTSHCPCPLMPRPGPSEGQGLSSIKFSKCPEENKQRRFIHMWALGCRTHQDRNICSISEFQAARFGVAWG